MDYQGTRSETDGITVLGDVAAANDTNAAVTAAAVILFKDGPVNFGMLVAQNPLFDLSASLAQLFVTHSAVYYND